MVVFGTLSYGSYGETYHALHKPMLTAARTGIAIHSLPSSVSHQSLTQLHDSKTVVQPLLIPAVKTTTQYQQHHIINPPIAETMYSLPVTNSVVHSVSVANHHSIPNSVVTIHHNVT